MKPHRRASILVATSCAVAMLAGGVALIHAQPPAEGDSGSTTAAVDAGPAPAETTPPADTDIATLEREYRELREALFQSRARAATVASALYSTRIAIKLHYATARFYTIDRAIIRLDGATVFEDTEGKIASDGGPRFAGYVAPGRHMVTIRVEVTGVDDARFTSATESSFVVMAKKGSDVTVTARAADDGDMAYAWKKDHHGTYKLGLDIDVKAAPRASK
ncbi:MAG TPA: hypothetical protein VFG83_11345 [Kofleriaceae bacterium]|nr:hypothetical protein [Kofleriaceae bacterium]